MPALSTIRDAHCPSVSGWKQACHSSAEISFSDSTNETDNAVSGIGSNHACAADDQHDANPACHGDVLVEQPARENGRNSETQSTDSKGNANREDLQGERVNDSLNARKENRG